MRVRIVPIADFALQLRMPSRASLRGLLVSVLKWVAIGLATHALVSFGPRTRLGPGLVGVACLLLVLEALFSARRRWRARVFDTLRFFVPLCSLHVLFSLLPGSCCFCDQSPEARTLRAFEFFGDFFYCNAIATIPAFVVLAALGRPSASSVERDTHVHTVWSIVLATLLVTVSFGGSFTLLRPLYLPSEAAEGAGTTWNDAETTEVVHSAR